MEIYLWFYAGGVVLTWIVVHRAIGSKHDQDVALSAPPAGRFLAELFMACTWPILWIAALWIGICYSKKKEEAPHVKETTIPGK